MSIRSGITLQALSLALALAGLGGLALDSSRAQVARVMAPAQGDFWTAASRKNEPLRFDTSEPGLVIGPGDVLRLKPADGPGARLSRISFRAQRSGSQSAYLRVHFRDTTTSLYRLMLLVGPTVQASLSRQDEQATFTRLDALQREVAVADPAAPYEVELRLDGGRFEVDLNGQRLLAAEDTRLDSGRLSIYADGVCLSTLAVDGAAIDADGTSRPFALREDLHAAASNSAVERAGARRGGALAGIVFGLVTLVLAAFWLRALCLGRPPAGLVLRAALAGLAPVAALCAVHRALELPWGDPTALALVAALVSIGLLFALFTLREQLAPEGVSGGEPLAGRALLVTLLLAGGVA